MLRRNGFLIGLFCAVALAIAFPQAGVLSKWSADAGVALILLIQGLSTPLEKLKASIGHWRLHFVIQFFTFGAFPVVGLLFQAVLRQAWAGEPDGIRRGLLFLCLLPSTVSTSVVLTAVAGGNTPAAVLSAALSTFLGAVATPVLAAVLMRSTGASGPIGPLIGPIIGLTVGPFAIGGLLRLAPRIRARMERGERWCLRISNALVLLLVYAAFSESVGARLWGVYGVRLIGEVAALVIALFGAVSILAYAATRLTRLDRADSITAYFCSVKKALGMGVLLGTLIFGRRADLGLILLPIMLYYPFQLAVNGALAGVLARRGSFAVAPPAQFH